MGLDQIATAHDNARLCCTEQFIARARHQIEPCRDRSRRGLLTAAHQDVIGQKRARTLVLVEQQTMLVGQGGKLPRAHFLVKALDAIVGRMDLEDHGRIGRDGALVVEGVRLVRGAHLNHAGVRLRHDIGHAEAAAMTSGIRKLPPISTSSPRLTITSLPAAWVASTSSTAAALLLTTSASSAPVSERMSCAACSLRDPREQVSTLYSSVL